ncbi:MAG: hypothetical protein ACXQTY_05215 [Candidatus Methanogasteraceae archaeon]
MPGAASLEETGEVVMKIQAMWDMRQKGDLGIDQREAASHTIRITHTIRW